MIDSCRIWSQTICYNGDKKDMYDSEHIHYRTHEDTYSLVAIAWHLCVAVP